MAFDDSSESELASRAKAGDAHAFDRLVRECDRKVVELAARLLNGTGDRGEAEDVRQLAWIRVWQGIAAFDDRSRFTTWLYRIVVNLCRDRQRERARREAHVTLDEGGRDGRLLAAEAEPDETLAREETASRVRAALAALPDDERECLVLRHFHGLPSNEIGAIVGRPRTTVQSCLARALARLTFKLRPLVAHDRPHSFQRTLPPALPRASPLENTP